jgi:hypothetical protein
MYMGVSDKHSSTVPLVLNPTTGVISPQFNVVVDEWFATIPMSEGEMPDFTKEEWSKMFGENRYHYLWDDEEVEHQENLPPPNTEAVDRRENRVIGAMLDSTPPVLQQHQL